MAELPKPVLAYCRTGMRSTTMWSLSQSGQMPLPQIIERASRAGFELQGVVRRIVNGGRTPVEVADATHEVVIVGGGAAGIAVAASLLARSPGLDIAIVDPADIHYDQPGWTPVGGGVFDAATTARTMASVVPHGVHCIKSAVVAFEPERDALVLDGCRVVRYRQLVVCCGLKLDWHGIDGLVETLGRHGVTSNDRYELAPYTWQLVQQLHRGKALFTQPPMPIKCAGALQKAMYLSADHWRRQGTLGAIDIQFCTAGAVLFGVADYVPALMAYVQAYGIGLNFGQTLIAVDGPGQRAVFRTSCRRRRRRTSCASARWPTPPAGSTSIPAPCATGSSPTCSRWATSPTPPTRRRRPRRASRHRWSRTTCSSPAARPGATPATTATAPAR